MPVRRLGASQGTINIGLTADAEDSLAADSPVPSISAFFRTYGVMQLPADRVVDKVEAWISVALGRGLIALRLGSPAGAERHNSSVRE
jgi:hypothetical protein